MTTKTASNATPTTARRSSKSACQRLRMRARPRIEPHVGDVDEEVGGEHRQRDEQEQALHERVVLVAHRLHEQVAEAWIREDDLGEQRSREHEAERHAE